MIDLYTRELPPIPKTYERMKMVSFDTETHLIQPGLLAPPLVCGSSAFLASNTVERYDIEAKILDAEATLHEYLKIAKSQFTMCGANIAYDVLVVLAEVERRWPKRLREFIEATIKMYDEDRVFDLQIADKLFDIGEGHLNQDRYGNPRKYSLDACAANHGIPDAKKHDYWRMRYADLEHRPISDWPEEAREYPLDDARNTLIVTLRQLDRAQDSWYSNIYDLPVQCRTHFALQVGAVYGFRVDLDRVEKLRSKTEAMRASKIEDLIKLGFYRREGNKVTKNTNKIKRAIIEAFEPDAPLCPECDGGGLVKKERVSEKTGKPLKAEIKTCKPCQGTGLKFSNRTPTTDKDGISTSRDSLFESEDPRLLKLADYSESDKTIGTYLAALGKSHVYTLNPRTPLETGRVSYGGVEQTMSKNGGERHTIPAREGKLLYSIDYEGLELSTHAQNCIDTLGFSELANALNSGGKPHNMLGAKLSSVSVEEFNKILKNEDHPLAKEYKNKRQAAKVANFGFPGGLGELRLVFQQREQGPDTISASGKKYRGLRLCILLGYGAECGEQYIYEYNKQDCGRVCRACVEAAKDLRQAWFNQWPENKEYFKWVSKHTEQYGYIVGLRSHRIRGGVQFTDGANGPFQELASQGATRALYEVVKQQMIATPDDPLWGSRNILFAHDELIGECDADVDRAHNTVTAIKEIMIAKMKEVVPDVYINAEETLMDTWQKAAALVRDEKGRVICWHDKPEKQWWKL